MANEKWSQKPLITEISNTTEFCILDEAIPKNKRINAKALLDAKANSSTLSSHTSDTDNPHSVTKTQVGLGNVDNTSDASKPISIAQQIALDLKAPLHNPAFTGSASFENSISVGGTAGIEGDALVSENVIADGDVRGYKIIADTGIQFGDGAKIKIQTGTSGGTPVYREFPATELASSDLNGTNYLMVYGTGTPTENAAELQAAYNAAKKMPRFLGVYDDTAQPPEILYEGQTYKSYGNELYYKVESDLSVISISEAQAKSVRTTVIVAPGEYNFEDFPPFYRFNINTSGIDVKSLTGKRDVLINSVNVSSDWVYVSGINCGTGKFDVSSNLSEIVLENCKGGTYSFVSNGTASGTFIDCIGGNSSFASSGTASGTFIRCVGGTNSFVNYGGAASGTFIDCTARSGSFGHYGTITGTLINCKITDGTYTTPTGEGKIYNCIDGNGALVNYPEVYAIKNNPTFTGITSGIRKNVSVKDTSVTLGLSDDIVIPSGAGTALTLPSAIGIKGKEYTIKNGLISSFKASMTCAGYGSAFVTSSSVEGLNITSGDAIQIVGDSNVYSIISISGSSINVSSSVSFPSGSEFYIYHKLRTTDNQTIDGYPPIPLTSDWEKLTVVSDGVGWLIV